MIRRREILKTAIVLAAGQLAGTDLADAAAAAQAPQPATATGTGPAKAFDYAWLKGQARFLAGSAYQASKDVLPAGMAALSYDQYQSLRFRGDHALWSDAALPFRLQFFHVGRGFAQDCSRAAKSTRRRRSRSTGRRSRESQAANRWAVRDGLEGRRHGIPRGRILSRRRRRHAAIRFVGAGARRGYRLPSTGGIPALHLFLVRAAGKRFRKPDDVCADGLAQHYGCAALFHRARRHAGHGHRFGLLSAQGHRQVGSGAVDQHVFLRRKRAARGQRLAA